jgi:predicted enzyme related to lactoylglutathione lyase
VSDTVESQVGTVVWRDLAVRDAEGIRDFYRAVVGWESRAEDMGGFSDYHMLAPSTGESVAGICHAQGSNADLPPQWLIYITVDDIGRSVATCIELGGEVLIAPRSMGDARFCVIRDPAGAVCALYQG